jgi:murein DD-endopeptidase MepM/ murein hydrolase activator NlpD
MSPAFVKRNALLKERFIMGRKSSGFFLSTLFLFLCLTLWPTSPLTTLGRKVFAQTIRLQQKTPTPQRQPQVIPTRQDTAALLPKPARKRQALSLISILSPARAGTISGRVTDPAGRPMAGIAVTLQADDLAAVPITEITNWDGSYHFPIQAEGGYTLTPTHQSYRFWPASIPVHPSEPNPALDFTAIACLPGFTECIAPPLLDLPVDTSRYDGPISDLLLGNALGQGPGLVNAWYDHTTPTYQKDERITRWDGLEFPARGRQGVSWYDGHDGIDFTPDTADLTNLIFPAAPGTITMTVTGCLPGDLACGGYLGNQVWIDHGGGFATVYAHLETVYVKDGEIVQAGEERIRPVGLMGLTGNSRGVNPIHLHFGLYYDPDKHWLSGQKSIDPYGWWGAGGGWTSETGLGSLYLWKVPLLRQVSLGEEGATIQSASGRVVAAIPSTAGEAPAAVRLLETPASFLAASGWRSTGLSFSLDIAGPENEIGFEETLNVPATLQVAYTSGAIAHLDPAQLTLARWDSQRFGWQALPSQVDPTQGIVQAQSTQTGRFEVQGPLLCPEDIQEPDDTPRDSTGLSKTDLSIRSIFDISEDRDWFWFVAKGGDPIRFQFTNPIPGLQPRLEIYDFTGIRLLAALDTSLERRLDWNPPANGAYFMRISAPPGSPAGCGVYYELLMKDDFER